MRIVLQCPKCGETYFRYEPLGIVMPRCESGRCTYAALTVVDIHASHESQSAPKNVSEPSGATGTNRTGASQPRSTSSTTGQERTHFVPWDTPLRRVAKHLRAVCTQTVPREQWSDTPTCPECREWLEEYDRAALE
jgi:hypothetical protein